jgi:molybdenum cofactor cytidylyltransferase
MISAILLAAGQSKRMKDENKLLKKIRGIPLIKHSIKNILDTLINELIIVTGHQKEVIEKIIDKNEKIKFVHNKDFESGMASSIKTGLNNLSKNSEFFFICLGDMPYVNKNIYEKLIEARKKNEIVVPIYKKLQGNPVLFSIRMKEKIMNIQQDSGAKKILELNKGKIFSVEINDFNTSKNFNTKDDFISE